MAYASGFSAKEKGAVRIGLKVLTDTGAEDAESRPGELLVYCSNCWPSPGFPNVGRKKAHAMESAKWHHEGPGDVAARGAKWHQVASPEASPDLLAENAPGCFPKIKGKAWFRQHLPEDGKTAVELVGCNLHVFGRFGAVKLYEIVDVQNCAIEIC